VASLNANERDRLSTSAMFVREDAETLSLVDLEARLAAVASPSNNDKPSKLLHARYAKRRVLQVEELAAAGSLGKDDSEAFARILRFIDELEAQVEDKNIKQKRDRARAKADRAKDTAWHLRMRLQDVDGTTERAMEQSRRETLLNF
jgi:hypothetical protein